MRHWGNLPVPFLRYPAEWDRYGRSHAGVIRNQQMARVATHLVAFWDGASTGTASMIKMATNDGLSVRVVCV
ncbi:MAG: hypothetical protein ACREPQ_14230 [Rhodanobacter sp.]